MDRRGFITQTAGLAGLTLLAQQANAIEEKNAAQLASTIRVKLSSVYVDDQAKALKFYTEILGFMKKQDIPVGGARWLTVVPPDDLNGHELLLEPTEIPASKVYQKALFDMGVPFTAFFTSDIQKEYDRLTGLGVKFRMKPVKMGGQTITNFEDTCGNLIQLYQV